MKRLAPVSIVCSDRKKSYEVANALADKIADWNIIVSVNEFGISLYEYLRKLADLLFEGEGLTIEIGTYLDYHIVLGMEHTADNRRLSASLSSIRDTIFKNTNPKGSYYDKIFILHDPSIDSSKLKEFYETHGEHVVILRNDPTSILVKAMLRHLEIRSKGKCNRCGKENELENGKCYKCHGE